VIRGALLAVSLLPLGAWAADADGWETVSTGAVKVRSRARPGTAVREIRAEADVKAPALAVQQAILSCERYAAFMPFVKEVRYLEGTSADATFVTYTRLAPPLVAGRDFVVECRTTSVLAADGSGEFSNEWRATPDRLPHRPDTVRLRLNVGSWHVTSRADGGSHLVYQFTVDPGGLIPPFIADLANRSALPDTLHAVEKEAQRLAAAAPR
jgi:hypothetical protein